ncbi:MAG: RNA polymerase sigma factor [Candidatus Binataceae bacterium]
MASREPCRAFLTPEPAEVPVSAVDVARARPPLSQPQANGHRGTARMKSRPIASPTPPQILLAIEAARGGDRQALEDVVRHYQERIARFVISIVGLDADYEDLSQTAFVKMALGISRLRSIEIFEAWLFKIARNVCMDYLRRLRWRRLFVPFTRDHEAVPASDPDGHDRIDAFEAALVQLSPDQRELMSLLRDHDWSYEQLAEITRSSVSAVGTRLFRARARLRTLLRQVEQS